MLLPVAEGVLSNDGERLPVAVLELSVALLLEVDEKLAFDELVRELLQLPVEENEDTDELVPVYVLLDVKEPSDEKVEVPEELPDGDADRDPVPLDEEEKVPL